MGQATVCQSPAALVRSADGSQCVRVSTGVPEAFPHLAGDPPSAALVTCKPAEGSSRDLAQHRLFLGSASGDLHMITSALEAGVNVETRQVLHPRIKVPASRAFFEEEGVLHQSLSNEPEETVELVGGVFRLQGTGRPPRCKDAMRGRGSTPLMVAAKAGLPEVVAHLLKARASPYSKDEHGQQALHMAASAGCRESCKALLHARASPCILDDCSRNAFACLPPACTADVLDRVQWVALLRPRDWTTLAVAAATAGTDEPSSPEASRRARRPATQRPRPTPTSTLAVAAAAAAAATSGPPNALVPATAPRHSAASEAVNEWSAPASDVPVPEMTSDDSLFGASMLV